MCLMDKKIRNARCDLLSKEYFTLSDFRCRSNSTLKDNPSIDRKKYTYIQNLIFPFLSHYKIRYYYYSKYYFIKNKPTRFENRNGRFLRIVMKIENHDIFIHLSFENCRPWYFDIFIHQGTLHAHDPEYKWRRLKDATHTRLQKEYMYIFSSHIYVLYINRGASGKLDGKARHPRKGKSGFFYIFFKWIYIKYV